MPIEPQDIRDRESFKQWLDERPAGVRRKTAIVLASRLAARVLPVLTRSGRPRKLRQFADLSLPVFRANLISRAAAATAYSAAATAYSAAATAYSAADSAAADSAATAATAATADIWGQLRLDVDWLLLKGATALLRRPLWNEAPDWWQESNGAFREILPASEWRVWFDWYDSIAAGQPAFGLPAKAADALEKRIALGDHREGFWDREPKAINAEIAGWVAETRGISAIPKAQNSGLRFRYSGGQVQLARGSG